MTRQSGQPRCWGKPLYLNIKSSILQDQASLKIKHYRAS